MMMAAKRSSRPDVLLVHFGWLLFDTKDRSCNNTRTRVTRIVRQKNKIFCRRCFGTVLDFYATIHHLLESQNCSWAMSVHFAGV